MNSTIVVAWVGLGVFTALIATHLKKDHAFNSGASNLAVGVLGALLGGFLMYELLGGRRGYNAFLVYSVASLLVSSAMLHFTRRLNRHGASSRVS